MVAENIRKKRVNLGIPSKHNFCTGFGNSGHSEHAGNSMTEWYLMLRSLHTAAFWLAGKL